MAARPHTAASRSPCHLSSSSNYLDTPIIAREYDKQSDGQPDPRSLYPASSDEKPPLDFVSFAFENRKEVLY